MASAYAPIRVWRKDSTAYCLVAYLKHDRPLKQDVMSCNRELILLLVVGGLVVGGLVLDGCAVFSVLFSVEDGCAVLSGRRRSPDDDFAAFSVARRHPHRFIMEQFLSGAQRIFMARCAQS